MQEVAKSDHVQRKLAKRQATRTLDTLLDEQVASGRFLACISSRPGQVCGNKFVKMCSVRGILLATRFAEKVVVCLSSCFDEVFHTYFWTNLIPRTMLVIVD